MRKEMSASLFNMFLLWALLTKGTKGEIDLEKKGTWIVSLSRQVHPAEFYFLEFIWCMETWGFQPDHLARYSYKVGDVVRFKRGKPTYVPISQYASDHFPQSPLLFSPFISDIVKQLKQVSTVEYKRKKGEKDE